MASRILTFNINGQHKIFHYPPFRAFTIEKVNFWNAFEEEIKGTRDENGISRVTRATYDKLLILVNRNEEVNSEIWSHVETVDISNPRTSQVNQLVSSVATSDVISGKVILEPLIVIIRTTFSKATVAKRNNFAF